MTSKRKKNETPKGRGLCEETVVKEIKGKLFDIDMKMGEIIKNIDNLNKRIETLESSKTAIEEGIRAGEHERERIRKIRHRLYSSYEGFNTLQWVKNVTI